jgi:POT family proton-dependent oligopeptide transporter
LRKRTDDEKALRREIRYALLAVFAFVISFWALFDQSNSTWVLQGTQMEPFRLLGLTSGVEQMQSLNPLLVMILVPLLTWGLYPFAEKFGFRITPLRRISSGLLLAAFSFAMVAWLQHRIEAGEKLNLAWQTLPYIILTTSEVLVSTTGLEFAYTQAAPSMKSAIMSFWLLSIALGNLLVATVTRLGGGHGDESVTTTRFLLYAALMAGVGVLFIVIAVRYQYREQPTGACG